MNRLYGPAISSVPNHPIRDIARLFVVRHINREILQVAATSHPIIDRDLEALILRIAKENRSWGYERIVGVLANLAYEVSNQTVGNVLRRHGIPVGRRNFVQAHHPVPSPRSAFPWLYAESVAQRPWQFVAGPALAASAIHRICERRCDERPVPCQDGVRSAGSRQCLATHPVL